MKMKKYIKKSLVLFFNLVALYSFGQQEAQYTHYMYNPSIINPAFAGYRNSMTAVLLHRSQWIGLDGAPTSQTFSISSPLKNEKVALGFNISNDRIGPVSKIGVNADFSYTIMTETANISYGIKVGAQRMSFDPSKLSIQDNTDIDYKAESNQFIPQIGVGLMLEKENLYLGVSVLNLIETDYKNTTQNSLYQSSEKRSYFGSVGYIFKLSNKLDLKTSMLTKMVFGAPLQIDLSTNFLINKKVTLGAAYRLDAAVSGLLGYQISESFLIGAAYDYDISPISKQISRSGEIVLRYDLSNAFSSKRILNPRIF